jgi:photosystem II stability/assembly factor-like uncharacterized protein
MRMRFFMSLVAALSIGMIGQAQQQQPRDDAYRSTYVPKSLPTSPDQAIKDDPIGRAEALKEQYGGEFTPEFMEAVTNAANLQTAEYGAAGRGGIKVPAGGAWTNVGPDRSAWIQNGVRLTESDTGRIRAILVHPTNADIVYIVKSSGGLWKTTNFSHPTPAWRPMSDNILSTSSGSAAFGRNPETIFLGSGDPFDPGVGGTIYRSLNGGETWGPGFKLGASTVIWDIKVDSNGPTDVVLAGTNAGLFRSIDGGATYTQVPFFGPAVIRSMQPTSAGWIVAITSGATAFVTHSADRGATWTILPNTAGIGPAGRMTLGVGRPGDAIVYAFAAKLGNTRQKDLYRSTDGGLNFTAIGLGDYVTSGTPPTTTWVGKVPENPYSYQTTMDIMFDQASYNQMLLVDPSDASRNTVYIGGQFSSAKTTNGGATWRVVSAWLAQNKLPYVHADHHTATTTTIGGKQMLLFGNDGGLFTSDDAGATFSTKKNEGMSSYLIYALTGNPKHPDDVLIGLQDNGTRWRVGPTATYNMVFGGDGFGVAWSQADDLVSLGSVYYSFIIRNRRNPSNVSNKWEVGWTGIPELNNPTLSHFRTSLATPTAAADPSGLTFFHRTVHKLYRTTNGAASWQPVLEVFNPNGPPPASQTAGRVILRAGMHPIGISPDNINHFGVLANGGHAFFTADGGTTWLKKIITSPPFVAPVPMEPGATPTFVPGWPGFNSSMAYADNDTIYVANEAPVGQTTPINPPLRVIKSTDGGNTFTAASGSVANRLPNVPINKLLVSNRDASGQTVYAATWIGVYVTTDGGANWTLFGSGLPTVNVTDLYMPTDGSYLRVSTFGRGVWEHKF